ncbi:MAG TPA: hypothetical protein VKG64_03715 [Methylomirabilota bacterium]|jgi:hypothetical protein|nr:hypothetical protein [Methylomirabilota bacterium]
MTEILAMVLISALIFLPLGLRTWIDRKESRAERIGAEIRAAVNRKLHGESLLSVRVTREGLWHPGRVVLDAPRGYEEITQAVWPTVVKRLPEDYELVVKTARDLPRAA